ncbi:META domain-containing protein [Synechococcus sp. CS-1329]|uniref:META domain-containing protein n=1 Tax=Synechococcus sp. CS-1329 TaxID=2847975 RepID=UPI00223C3473|nr:META domain-containing protein [Synechococcus sp. CS-1329]MCT0217423.1 META domain-containing protein [Synechococcus sp. CS-1329]
MSKRSAGAWACLGLALAGLLTVPLAAPLAQARPPAEPAGEAPRRSPLEGSAWLLESLPGRRALIAPTPTLRLEQGRVSGSDGCNRYSAAVQVRDSIFRLNEQGPSTQMACPDKQMRQAEAFRAALTAARGYALRNGQLELMAANGKPLARFRPQPQEIAGALWIVTGLNNGKQAVVSTLTGTTLSLELSSRGRLAGTAGCNRYNAAAVVGQGTIQVSRPPAATRRVCVRPRGVMEQEIQFLNALQSASQWQIEANRLELRRPDGALAITLRRADGR